MKAFILFSLLLLLSLICNSSALLDTIIGKLFSKDHCPIKLYNPKDPSFTGHQIYANVETFHPLLETLASYAKECGVKINIKQSFIQEDVSKSPIMLRDYGAMAFRLGQAIEFELVDRNNQLICGQSCLKKRLSRLKGVRDAKCFLQKLSQNSDLHRDHQAPTILIKQTKSNETLMTLHDIREELQKKCKKLQMNQ